MSFSVRTSMADRVAQRSFHENQRSLQVSMEQLVSGTRTGDAVAQVLSDQMGADVAAMRQASRNAWDGQSMLASAEGALDRVGSALERMEELAVQYDSGTLSDEQKALVQAEFDTLKDHMGTIAGGTEWNSVKLMQGDTVQFGVEADGGTRTIELPDVAEMVKDVDIADASTIREARENVTSAQAYLGTQHTALTETREGLDEQIQASVEARNRVSDADVAEMVAALVNQQTQQSFSVAMMAQGNRLDGDMARRLLYG